MDYIITGMALLFPIVLYIAVSAINEKDKLEQEVEWLRAVIKDLD